MGKTPIVPINRLNPHSNVEIYAKLEGMNPGGSVKDRIAKFMIESAERAGKLTAEKIVLEATSGNTGIGLAMVCAIKGYKCMLVMPESASIERRKIMTAYGAEILLTPAKKSTDGAIEQVYAMVRENPDKYFLTDQFNNNANWQAHVEATGPEIWEQTAGEVTDIVATLGTSGTVMGLCHYFTTKHSEVKVTAVEPYLGHKIQGLKNMKESYRPGIFDKNKPYQIINVEDEPAFAMARQLAAKEGLFVGMSSGCAMVAALERAAEMEEGVIVVIFPDSGDKYLSTSLFSAESNDVDKPKNELKFYNALTRKKSPFQPLRNDKVSFYACGPTAFEPTNLSHCRRFIVADLIQRTIIAKGWPVEFMMNFTDIDDNTIAGAENTNQSVADFTNIFIKNFTADLADLGVKTPTKLPLASDYVEEMINISKELINKGYAYELHGSIYFDISKFSEYGKLSKVDLDNVRSGQSADLDNYEKRSPLDFTLMKRTTLNELKRGIFYQTEYGNMRPGWHIECAAMTQTNFGATMDIHTASRNLIFPHHENENAIAKALTGKPLANYWLHSELLTVDGKMMAAENSNIITLQEVVAQGYTCREVRFFLLRHHYRKPLEFTYKKLDAARTTLRRFDEFTTKLLCLPTNAPHPELASIITIMEEAVFRAMDDDLNTSKAIGAIFDFIKKVNPILADGHLDKDQKKYILEILEKINTIFNIFRLDECPLSPEINDLIKKREIARAQKDWQTADEVREQLMANGLTVTDTAIGPIWCLSKGVTCEQCQQGDKPCDDNNK